jgi:broad specificity phosphatase PhoE
MIFLVLKNQRKQYMPALNPSTIPQKIPASVIIRHAERFEISAMKNALEILLTEKGKEDARNLGKEIEVNFPVTLFHSPVTRCKETADMILNGLEDKGVTASMAGMEMNLGGPYITGDWDEITRILEKIGQIDFIDNWFNEEYPRDLILPLNEAAKMHIELLKSQLENHDTTFINVSHDWNILILRQHFFGDHFSHKEMPYFLDGHIFNKENGGYRLTYHGHSVIV